jgi:hypothetical protein
MRMTEKISSRIILFLGSLFFFVLITLTNSHDWDSILSENAVDWYSWVVSGELPLWSYQLCAGSSRWGNPQSYGLSPLISFFLVFGVYWGGKVVLLALFFMGFYFAKKILEIFYDQNEFLNTALALSFVLGNAFLWHFAVGNIYFSHQYIALGIIYYFLISWVKGGLALKELMISTLLVFLYFSGGFYAGLFLLIPFLLIWFFFLLFQLFTENKAKALSAIKSSAGFFLLGLLLSSYKIYGVLKFREMASRSYSDLGDEVGSLTGIFLSQFAPTFGDKFLGAFDPWGGRWGIWEESAFSIVNVLFLFFLYLVFHQKMSSTRSLKKKQKTKSKRSKNKAPQNSKEDGEYIGPEASSEFLSLKPLLVIAFVVTIGFCLGDLFIFLPHAALNEFLGKAIRCIGRYQVSISFFIFISLGVLLRKSNYWLQGKAFVLGVIVFLLSSLNLITLAHNASFDEFKSLSAKKTLISDKIKTHLIQPKRPDLRWRTSYQLFPFAEGYGVMNCYISFPHEGRLLGVNLAKNLKGELKTSDARSYQTFPILENSEGTLPSSCLENSYLTSNDIHLDPSCPKGTCAMIMGLNPYKESSLKLNQKKYLYCL